MRRTTLYGILVALVLGTLASVVPASASAAGRRNTAAALTGLAAYELLRGHTGPGLIAGAGAVYAWQRAEQARRAEEWSRRYGYAYRPYAYTCVPVYRTYVPVYPAYVPVPRTYVTYVQPPVVVYRAGPRGHAYGHRR